MLIYYKYISEDNQNAQNDKSNFSHEKFLETPFHSIKMCTGFTTDVIWINTICAVSLANHLSGAADRFCPLRTHQQFRKSER